MYKCINDKLNENNIEYLLYNLVPDNYLERAIGFKKVFFKPNDKVTIRLEIDSSVTNKANVEYNTKTAKGILEMLAFPFINLNFVWVDDKFDGVPNIRIVYSENSKLGIAGSTTGSGTDKVLIYLFGFSQGSLLHELGHALGRLHEHNNPDKSNPIKWIKEKVYDYYTKIGWSKKDIDNFMSKYDKPDDLAILPFDTKSVMIYQIDGQMNEGGITIFKNNVYSDGDIQWFELQYGKKLK